MDFNQPKNNISSVHLHGLLPSEWDGDHRTLEALASDAAVLCDASRPLAATRTPPVDGVHWVTFSPEKKTLTTDWPMGLWGVTINMIVPPPVSITSTRIKFA